MDGWTTDKTDETPFVSFVGARRTLCTKAR